ncbi:acetoacetyl-CoA synthase [Ophiocordyceps camponoti-floridani]|uniref:Acetoacetyl-CoA synthase n=1 Tax=Ophiocordyceps camponoti-floridani TaxID=2030778 RepID=A0A8H4Q455_9HYPO|nr:acetoacetyl-CoA synthase [Ophiocordyceps camponoti-floridani]
MKLNPAPRKLWEHPNPKDTSMWCFMQLANRRYDLQLKTYWDLYNWSCDQRAAFYRLLWEYHPWIHAGSYSSVVDESVPITKLPRWFQGVELNLAENFLWTPRPGSSTERDTSLRPDEKIALTEVREGNCDVTHVTFGELRARAGRMAGAMRAAGGILQRLHLIRPKLVFFDDGAVYNGKRIDLRDKIRAVVDGLVSVSEFQKLIMIPRFTNGDVLTNTESLEKFLEASSPSSPPMTRFPFEHPAVIYFTSGTTGPPKAIVHGIGPILCSAVKEPSLHMDLSSSDVVLGYTTTGWIMYLLSLFAILVGARPVLYDGSPFVPDPTVLLRVASQQSVSCLGISPRWMSELERRRIRPRDVVDLSCLKLVYSTGTALPEHMFHWFYDVAFPPHTGLSNASGGTEIAGAFAIGNPLLPVHAGGCVAPILGIRIRAYDSTLPPGSEGKPVPDGEPGDLVATTAFPNVPVFFWGDSDPSPGNKYRSSYFTRFQDVWTHGDLVAFHPVTGAVHFLGRTDGVLNPSGVRFGSADIYAVIEGRFADSVLDSLCVGQRRRQDTDEAVYLFLVMKPGFELTVELTSGIKEAIALDLSKRHVPKYIFQAPELPMTINGKKVELPVKTILSGETVTPSGTLLNPPSLDFFYRFQRVEEVVGGKARL